MSTKPLISIVMSVFNGEQFLAEAFDSLLNQTLRDFELIVVNDGSTDGSGAILDSYQKKDSRLRVYHQENKGLIFSLNRGCGLAAGEYIARMDADDVAVPDRLALQFEFLKNHPNVGVVAGAVQFIDTAGRALCTTGHPNGDQEIKSALLEYNVIWHPTVLMRTDVFLASGGYRASFRDAEDYDLWLRIAERCQLVNLEQVLIKYRIHSNQVSQRKLKQQALSALAARTAASARKKGDPDPFDSADMITSDLLTNMGVSQAEQQRALTASYLAFIRNMSMAGEQAAVLDLWMDMLRSSRCEYIEKSVLADARLAVAQVYWNQHKLFPSLLAVLQALSMRPQLVGRPLKILWRQFRKVYGVESNPDQGGSAVA